MKLNQKEKIQFILDLKLYNSSLLIHRDVPYFVNFYQDESFLKKNQKKNEIK